jgi:hypothetical protein
VKAQTTQKGKVKPAKFSLGWGSGACVVPDKYVLTAFHVLNGGQPRDPRDKFLVFVVPGNGPAAYHFPVVGFPLERSDLDLAVLELGASASPSVRLPALPVSFTAQPDGARVLTLGFPAPEVSGVSIDPQGNYLGGQFFLKSHANEGIVAAQYLIGQARLYEFNVGWHHGESGGPVVAVEGTPAVFTIMQHYRNVTSPHGVVAGPRRGWSLAEIQQDLLNLGVVVA